MKYNLRSLLVCIALCGAFIVNTSYSPMPVSNYIPIYMERSELEKSVFYQSTARDLVLPGKIYYKSPYIYVNERYKGVHVINNSNPSNPIKEGFIVAPGCIDMAVKGNVLYLDNSVDLVSFNLDTKQVTSRVKEVFPEPVAPDNMYYYAYDRPKGFVLVGWKSNPENN